MSSGRYKIIKEFEKQGGMATTSLAMDENLQRQIVIKKLNVTGKPQELIDQLNSQLRNEAINQGQITHSNIAKVHDYYVDDDGLGNIVMEYVEGSALEEMPQYINIDKNNEELLVEALDIIYQMVDAIRYAHSQTPGIVHRDIKLDNIMYDPKTKVVKIIDFGLSKIKEEGKRDGTVVFWGTPGYRPKELYDLNSGSISDIDETKRDIFALGISVYRILTGLYPYGIATPEDFSRTTPKISDYRDDISEELNEIFYSMIAVEPCDRLENLQSVLNAIQKQKKQGFSPLVKMPSMQAPIRIRDSIHGYIKINTEETKVLDNRFFQRLRNIKQLGTTYLVYPCAVHSRFEHSLGVMHIATRIFDEIASKYNDVLGWDEGEILRQRQILRLLALLHDIGHAPFSHVGDNLYENSIKDHEAMAAKIIRESELSTIIDEIGSALGGFTHREIAGLIEGKYTHQYSLIKQIFSGSVLDADRMDYLLRDSYVAGVKYGMYDLEHLIRSIEIDFVNGIPILAINSKGIYVLEEFVFARYYMFNQVYYHKTRRIYDKILEKCMINFLTNNYESPKLPTDINQYIKLDDHKVMSYMKARSSDPWNKMFLTRNHYSVVKEVFPHATDEDKIVINNIKRLFQEADIPADKYIIDEYHKAPIQYRDEEGNPMLGLIDRNNQSGYIEEYSYTLNNMDQETYIFRVYCAGEYFDQVRILIEEASKDVS